MADSMTKQHCIDHAFNVVARGAVYPDCYLNYAEHEAALCRESQHDTDR